jgi:hypothetical protein
MKLLTIFAMMLIAAAASAQDYFASTLDETRPVAEVVAEIDAIRQIADKQYDFYDSIDDLELPDEAKCEGTMIGMTLDGSVIVMLEYEGETLTVTRWLHPKATLRELPTITQDVVPYIIGTDFH